MREAPVFGNFRVQYIAMFYCESSITFRESNGEKPGLDEETGRISWFYILVPYGDAGSNFLVCWNTRRKC
jgi:hypothetical protein